MDVSIIGDFDIADNLIVIIRVLELKGSPPLSAAIPVVAILAAGIRDLSSAPGRAALPEAESSVIAHRFLYNKQTRCCLIKS